jgi:hypothetical protein
MPSYRTARLLTRIWTKPGHRLHKLIKASVEGGDATPDVVAYAVERPDHRLGVMLINRSAVRSHSLLLTTDDPTKRLAGMADVYSYGPEQYAWLDAGARSRVARNLPPLHRRQSVVTQLTLGPSSIIVAVMATPGIR